MNFENIAPLLFASNTHNRDIIRMDIDEACYLYILIKILKKKQGRVFVVEIGTYKGGSTALMACAGADVLTIDNYSSKTFDDYTHPPIQDVCSLLEDLEVRDKVTVVNGNSLKYDHTYMAKCDILLIDGDHSYEGVKSDYNHWKDNLKQGGHLLFHDSCGKKEGRIKNSEVPKLMPEIPFKKHVEVGSITHFIKEKYIG